MTHSNRLEHVVQSWWLASTRLRDCPGDRLTAEAAKDSLRDLRRNVVSARVAGFAELALLRTASDLGGRRAP